MRVLVTGASGFIGKHVCKALVQAGHEVIGFDIAGYNPSERGYMWADITLSQGKIDALDAVIHLAAVSHPRDCDNDPARAFNVNVNGTHQVLKMALESGARKVVFSSSAHVYDIPPRYLPSDEVHPLRLNNTYTTTKILGEELCRLYFENHGLSYTTLRLFNAYGPGQSRGYFIPDMLARAKQGGIDLQGGNTTKDWVYVTDVARAFLLALETPFVGAINIGTGVETRLDKIAAFLGEAFGASTKAQDSEKATRMCANVRRAERILGWSPTKSIWEGLDAVLDAAEVRPLQPQP